MTRNSHRRQVLMSAVVAAGWILGDTVPRTFAAGPRVVIQETRIVSLQPQYYHGWPTAIRRQSGELLVICTGGREEHVCPFGRLELMRSQDEGKSWGWPQVVLDLGVDARDASLMETTKGTLLAATFTSQDYLDILRQAEQIPAGMPGAWEPERLKRWQAARRRLTADQLKSVLGVWMIRSTDGGLTWSAPYRCQLTSPHGPIQLSDGRLFHAGKATGGDERVGVCESTDDGQTWHWLAEIPERPGDNSKNDYHELHAVEAANGQLIVHLRNHNANNFLETFQTESSDGGKTWTSPHTIGVWGLPSHLQRLKNGRLLMTYGYRRAPFGNQARVSNDHGHSWSEAMTISDDGVGIDLGYPSTTELADGSFLSVWYEKLKENPRAVLRQSHWTMAIE